MLHTPERFDKQAILIHPRRGDNTGSKGRSHHPDFPGIDAWLVQARDMINGRGGLHQAEPLVGVGNVTRNEEDINLVRDSAARYIKEGPLPTEEPKPAPRVKKRFKPY
jgi:hypothetical protein